MRPRKARQEDFAQMYFAAAQEHAPAALETHDPGRYVLFHYLAGLAVECLLQAYRYRSDPEFGGRHDLEALYAAAKFGDVVPEADKQSVGAARIEVARRWSNSHRFRSSGHCGNICAWPVWDAGASSSGKAAVES